MFIRQRRFGKTSAKLSFAQTLSLVSRSTALAVRAPGLLVAATVRLLNEPGRGAKPVLDNVFGIIRDESRGYFNFQGYRSR